MDSPTPSSDPFHGLNPADLMAAAAMPTDGGADTLPLAPQDLPSLAEIAAAFPDLEILDLIGHGGMSAVFRARQPRLDRIVALKVLPKSLAATPGFAERFTREGRVLARLSHPNIVTVHDFGESGGFCFLIMEYVDGVNLRQAMRAGRFTPEQALNIIPVMCEALQYAHSQGVLHRDIKPENILLDAKGRVKIADFGIAKILNEDGDGGMMLTHSGARLGTAPYMAPEQIEQPASVDHRADIYSLGVVFYEMLTGELPLGRFAAPSEKSSVSSGMDEVVFRALAKERERRQQSAGEFKTQIEGIASMPPMPRSSVWYFNGFEYKSKRTLLGRPLLHVAHGIDPATGRKRTARGFFAFGDRAIGVVAFGGYARGLFACGGMAVGVVAFGGMSIGVFSLGGLAIALLLAFGGLSVGLLATGGMALGWGAVGGVAAGVHGYGGQVYALVSGMGGQVHAPQVIKNLAQMPALLQWLVRVTNQSTYFMSWIWFPMMMPSLLVAWWARGQLEFEAQIRAKRAAAWHERPSRVLWILPASLLLFSALIWMTRHWSHAGEADMTAQIFIASAIEFAGLLLSVVSLPLWLRLVPMHSFYGARLPSTFVSDERWYDVSAVFGRQLFCWSLTVIAAGIAGFYQLPRHQDAYAWAALTLILVAVAASVASTLVWMHRHPVGRPLIKPHRLVRNLELVIPVVVLMLFIRSFIARPYFIPHGSEPGVAKSSRWIASHLNTGFAQGDLVAYEHESGRTWIARVVAVEAKGLRLKRGGSPEDFLMPWDKIIGKMLFSYYPPGEGAAPSAQEKAWPTHPLAQVSEGSRHVEAPVMAELKYVQVKLMGQKDWPPQIYDTASRLVQNAEALGEVSKSQPDRIYTKDKKRADECRVQLWFSHPDFDSNSMLEVDLLDEGGKPVWEGHGHTGPGVWSSSKQPPLRSCTLVVGSKGQLPRSIDVALTYSLGPWELLNKISPEFHGEELLRGNVTGHVTATGDDKEGRAFVSWNNEMARTRQIDCFALLKSGQKLGSLEKIGHGSKWAEAQLESVNFQLPLSAVESFQIRLRMLRRVVFKNIVIPPLP